jgi:hypothetical protein
VVEHDEAYRWNESRTIIVPQARFSPVIIEAGRRSDHGDLATFEASVLANRFELHRTVAANETRFIVVYEGIEADEIVFNAANPADIPTVAGVPVDYAYPRTFDCPFIQGQYGQAVVTITKGDAEARLDFNDATRSDTRRSDEEGHFHDD